MALPLPDEKTWTYADYCKLPDDGNRYEIIDGRLYMTPAPTTWHQILSRRLQFIFYSLELAGKGFIFDAPTDLFLPGADPVQPDLIYLTAEQKGSIRKKGIHGPPTLLVEILSPSTASVDRTVKLRKYAESQVVHYWLLDSEERTLEVFKLGPGGHYVLVASLGPGECFEPEDYPGLVVDMDALFADLPESAEEG